MSENLLNTNLQDYLQPGDTVYVELFYRQDNKIIIKTSIREINENQLQLNTEQNEHILSQLHQGINIVVFFRKQNKTNDVVFLARFIEFISETKCLVIEKKGKIFIGRRFFRCDVRLPFSYNLGYEMKGEVINLSISGLFARIKPDDRIQSGLVLTGKTNLPTETKPIVFQGKVTRLVHEQMYLGIGIRFTKIDDESLNQVNKYLFKRQQELITQKRYRFVR